MGCLGVYVCPPGCPLTVQYLYQANERVPNNGSLAWGTLGTVTVGVSGTAYLLPIPTQAAVEAAIGQISPMADPRERASQSFAMGARASLFWGEGKERTFTIVASRILIEPSQGVLTIGKSSALNFNETLLHFYDMDDSTPLRHACEAASEPARPAWP